MIIYTKERKVLLFKLTPIFLKINNLKYRINYKILRIELLENELITIKKYKGFFNNRNNKNVNKSRAILKS